MTIIKYKDMELEEFTSDKPMFIDPPVSGVFASAELIPAREGKLFTFDPRFYLPYTDEENRCWNHFFVLPKTPKFRRATYRELSKWLAKGNGEFAFFKPDNVSTTLTYDLTKENFQISVDSGLKVRKWDDTDWHEPTVDYMGVE